MVVSAKGREQVCDRLMEDTLDRVLLEARRVSEDRPPVKDG